MSDQREAFMRDLRSRHPRFAEAVIADAEITAKLRGERWRFSSRADAVGQAFRLAWESDAFLAQVLYRAKASLQARGVPLLPRLMHRLAIVTGQVYIGDPVVVQPGVYLLHGQVVIDGLTEIGGGTVIGPFVTIGLRQGDMAGPRIQGEVHIGTGAKVIGNVSVGAGSSVGANAVVVADVPAGSTVVGVPARSVEPKID